jgi:hypothetical protein
VGRNADRGIRRQLRDEIEAARRLEARQAVAGEAEKFLGERVRRRNSGRSWTIALTCSPHSIRGGDSTDATLVARQIGVVRAAAVASRGYLQRYGEPTSPHELKEHAPIRREHYRSEPQETGLYPHVPLA